MARLLTTGSGKPPPVDMDVLVWRYEELRKAGYPVDEALLLAEAGAVDLHVACDVLRQGCSAERALDILL